MLPRMPLESAVGRANALRKSFNALQLELGGEKVKLTLSAGVAVFPLHGRTAAELVHVADAALYEAKDGGRDQVRAAGPGAASEAIDQPGA